MLKGKVLITGGTGTLGNAILRIATEEGWDAEFTIFSRSWKNLNPLKRKYPKINIVLGDVQNNDEVEAAVAGHDLVIHAAAMKHVVNAELQPTHTFSVNVGGSLNVAAACAKHGVESVFISTDKSCNPANAYGASKLMMEKMVQEHAFGYPETKFHLVRYGNVLGSAGSFIPAWWKQFKAGETIKATRSDMSRFWLTERNAVQLIVDCLNEPSGTILVPLLPSANMKDIAEWLFDGEATFNYMGMRPGEKLHETLVTKEEMLHSASLKVREGYIYMRIYPTFGVDYHDDIALPYTSDDELNFMAKETFVAMVEELFGIEL